MIEPAWWLSAGDGSIRSGISRAGRLQRLPLKLYDPIVIGVVAGLVWRFPAIRHRHLDVGPGTGYLIDHSGIPDGRHFTIVDANPNVLRHAARRLRRLNVTAVEADVLKPLPVDGPFDSAALCLVISACRARLV